MFVLCCAPVWQVVHVPAVNKEEDLAEISRRANVPVSFQPAFTNRVPEDTEMLSGFAQTGARVYAQVSPRNFDLAIRLKHQSMILFGMPSWMEVMNLPPEERLEQFADPDRRPDLVAAFNDRPLDAITVKQTAHPANGRYEGQSLGEIAESEGKTIGEVLLDIAVLDELDTDFRLDASPQDKSLISDMMRLPFYQVGASDAGAHVAQLCGSGDTTVLLENYVKTGQQTLEEAVHYMTVAPQRGRLCPSLQPSCFSEHSLNAGEAGQGVVHPGPRHSRSRSGEHDRWQTAVLSLGLGWVFTPMALRCAGG